MFPGALEKDSHEQNLMLLQLLLPNLSVQCRLQENKLPIISLFTGIAGLELGLHKSVPQNCSVCHFFDLMQMCEAMQLASQFHNKPQSLADLAYHDQDSQIIAVYRHL